MSLATSRPSLNDIAQPVAEKGKFSTMTRFIRMALLLQPIRERLDHRVHHLHRGGRLEPAGERLARGRHHHRIRQERADGGAEQRVDTDESQRVSSIGLQPGDEGLSVHEAASSTVFQ